MHSSDKKEKKRFSSIFSSWTFLLPSHARSKFRTSTETPKSTAHSSASTPAPQPSPDPTRKPEATNLPPPTHKYNASTTPTRPPPPTHKHKSSTAPKRPPPSDVNAFMNHLAQPKAHARHYTPRYAAQQHSQIFPATFAPSAGNRNSVFSQQSQSSTFTHDVWTEMSKQQRKERDRNRVVDEEYVESARVVLGKRKRGRFDDGGYEAVRRRVRERAWFEE